MRTWREPTARESSEAVRERVETCRDIQTRRLEPHDLRVNAEITARLVPELCALDKRAESLLAGCPRSDGPQRTRTPPHAQAGAHHRRPGRRGGDRPGPPAEALQYRARLDDA